MASSVVRNRVVHKTLNNIKITLHKQPRRLVHCAGIQNLERQFGVAALDHGRVVEILRGGA